MSLSKPANRTEFKEYCLRKLGKPVIQINVESGQVEQSIDEALEFWHRNHYDGSIEMYLPFTVTEEVKSLGYFEVDETIISINKLCESGFNTSSQFTVDWQLIAQTYPFALKGDGLLTYTMALSYRELLKMSIEGKTKPIRWNRHVNRLFIDQAWSTVAVGKTFVAECYRVVDPDEFPEAWNDPFLKEYCTALIKKQWGNNLRKLRNVQLVGGVTIDGQEILQEAETELKELHERVFLEHQEPINFIMG